MKRLVFLLSLSGVALCGQDLSAVHSVYLFPMAQGLDQFLANRLTNEHVFQVTTNAKQADAVFTDSIGKSFEGRLAELTPEKKPVEKEAGKEAAGTSTSNAAAALAAAASPAPQSSFGGSKGTVFLVNLKSRQVLWSAYEAPKDSSPAQMDRTASDIVNRLKRDLNPKAK